MNTVTVSKQFTITVDEGTAFRLFAVIQEGLLAERDVPPGRRKEVIAIKEELSRLLGLKGSSPSGRDW